MCKSNISIIQLPASSPSHLLQERLSSKKMYLENRHYCSLPENVKQQPMPVIPNQNRAKNSSLPVPSSLSYSHIKAQTSSTTENQPWTLQLERGEVLLSMCACVQEWRETNTQHSHFLVSHERRNRDFKKKMTLCGSPAHVCGTWH